MTYICESHMVEVMVLRTCPEWDDVSQRPREIVSGVRIHRLPQSQSDPSIHGNDVQVLREVAISERSHQSTESQNNDFQRVCVFGGQSEWC